jgi:ABC-type lipoprotein release transport system permease subunit
MIRYRDQVRLTVQKVGLRKKRAFFSVVSVALGVIVVVAADALVDSLRDLMVRTQFTEQLDPNVVRIYTTENPYEFLPPPRAKKDETKTARKRYQFVNDAALDEMRAWPEVLAAEVPVTIQPVSFSALTNRPTNVSSAEGVPEELLRTYATNAAAWAACSNAIPLVIGERNARLAYNPARKKFDVSATNEVAAWIGREMVVTVGDHFADIERFEYDYEQKGWVPVEEEALNQRREWTQRLVRQRADPGIYATQLALRGRVVGLCPGNRVLLPLATAQELEKWIRQRAQLSSWDRPPGPEFRYATGGRTTPKTGEYREALLVIQDGADLEAVADKVRELGFEATTRGTAFESLVKEVDGAVKFVKRVLWALGAALLGLAAGLLWNTTSRVVVDSRVDIGLFRALGATKGDIRRLFLGEAVLLGVLGTTTGIVTGWGLAYGISRWTVSAVRDSMDDPEQMLLIPDSILRVDVTFALGLVVGAVLVSLLAGLWPAQRAARVDPVQALKRE